MESYEIKCTSCSLLLGESATAVENIVCVFCIDERNHFRWEFSIELLEALKVSLKGKWREAFDDSWEKYRRWKKYNERTFYMHQKREIELKEIQNFIGKLKRDTEK